MQSDFFEEIQTETPSPERLQSIRRTLAVGLTPVRPLPAHWTLVLAWTAGLALLAMLLAVASGTKGFHARSAGQILVEYTVLLASGWVLSRELAGRMIPGSRQFVTPWIAAALPLAALAVVLPVLFPDFSTAHFTHLGLPCFRYGILCSIPSAALTAWAFRFGYVTEPARATLTGAAFSGLTGVAALAIHCPILNAAHILIFHMGAFVAVVILGGVAGWVLSRRN